MKLIASLLPVLAIVAASSSARAQQPTKPAPTTTIRTAEYTEQITAGDQVVTFPGDELPAQGPSYYGDTVRRPPGVTRLLLIRPRLNFIPELQKSVEAL
jgi:hypothetical protein